LTYHVVGKLGSAEIAESIKKGQGRGATTTVQGGKLNESMKGKDMYNCDKNGNWAMVDVRDVFPSNGLVHVVDRVPLLRH
jgi:uncharacterized surface protein with fasciclin (FAS1) repeats